MNLLGADIVFNHADYRLISSRVLESFADYHEVNIFLRGMVPLVGFPSATVAYERHERLAGESHYPLSKMLSLAFDGITSLSNKPIRLITGIGMLFSLVSFIGVVWAVVLAFMGSTVAGWSSTHLHCLPGGGHPAGVPWGSSGEYIGKIYMKPKPGPAISSVSGPGPLMKGSITDDQTELARVRPPEPGAPGPGFLREPGKSPT